MPSSKKTIHFLCSTLVTAIAVGVLGYGLSADWAKATMDCARVDVGFFNETVLVVYNFFNGTITQTSCYSFEPRDEFEGNVLKL